MKINQFLKIEPKVEEKVLSVSEFLDFLNRKLTSFWAIVQGEVGNKVDRYPNYTFFNLLDKSGSILKCFVWRSVIDNLGVPLEGGMEIKILGYPEMRKDRGELKFQVQRVELVGEGILKRQFEILKRKLAHLGYFSPEIKKPIPRFPEKIGLITSKYGKGAKKDFETNLGKFGFQLFFYDVRVEGSFVLSEISQAINWFNQNFPQLDVLVLTRGGGDWESLQPFNSEEIVKVIRASRIPILTGIGHEDDETLADLAADLSASTPTEAAKILNENWKLASINIFEFEKNFSFSINKLFKNVKEKINFSQRNLTQKIGEEISSGKKNLKNLIRNLNLFFRDYFQKFLLLEKEFKRNFPKIKTLIKRERGRIEKFLEDLIKNQNRWKERIEKILRGEKEKLILSSPELKLKQGYTITLDELGQIIKEPAKLKISQLIETKFYKGQVLSKVKKIWLKKNLISPKLIKK